MSSFTEINENGNNDSESVKYSIVTPENDSKTNIPQFFTTKDQQNQNFLFNNILTKTFDLKYYKFKSPEILFSHNNNYCVTPHNKLYFNINKMMIIYKFISNTQIHYVYNIYQKKNNNSEFEKVFEWKVLHP